MCPLFACPHRRPPAMDLGTAAWAWEPIGRVRACMACGVLLSLGGYYWGPRDAPQGACGSVCLASDRCVWADQTALHCVLWSSVLVSVGPCLGAGVGPLRLSTSTRGFEPVHNGRGEGAR